MWNLRALYLLALLRSVGGFGSPRVTGRTASVCKSFDAPSDYDVESVEDGSRRLSVSSAEDDLIREDLKKELLLLASVTNRGEYASTEERDIVIDIVNQLEALNPTLETASNCDGEWDLCLSSTQFFRSSPFFQSIRSVLGDSNQQIGENFFDIHDQATTASRVGRVRQIVSGDSLVSEVDLEVGMMPGFPLRVKGTVMTKASKQSVPPETWELRVETTQVKGSNIPLFNEFLDNLQFELPVGDAYRTILGEVPVVRLKTFYVDDSIRITRDSDDNFFVFSRA